MTLEERRTIQTQRIQEKKGSMLKLEYTECKDPNTTCEHNHDGKCWYGLKCSQQLNVYGYVK